MKRHQRTHAQTNLSIFTFRVYYKKVYNTHRIFLKVEINIFLEKYLKKIIFYIQTPTLMMYCQLKFYDRL